MMAESPLITHRNGDRADRVQIAILAALIVALAIATILLV